MAVEKCVTIEEIQKCELLTIWFESLTKQAEAQRCIHYMFKQKMEKIDFNYLTWHNMQRIYYKYL